MLYILTGRGTMPPKEASTVLTQLLENAERDAVAQGLEELEFWLAIDSRWIDSSQKCWQAVANWASDNDVFIADAADLYEVVENAVADGERVAALFLNDGEVDNEVVRFFTDLSDTPEFKVFDISGQMYEMDFSERTPGLVATFSPKEPEPEDQAFAVDDSWKQMLEAMNRADLKAKAKELGVEPSDWRSKASIIEVLLPVLAESGSEVPDTYQTDKDSEPDTSVREIRKIRTSDEPEPHATDDTESEVEDLEALVERIVREQIRSILMAAVQEVI